MGIGETLCRALAKIVMREAGDQAKTACDNLQLCAGLEADIEGATNAIGQQIMKRSRARQREEEVRRTLEEEETENVAVWIGNLDIDMAGTEEEASESLKAAFRMDLKEEGEGEGEGEEGGDGTQRSLGSL